MVWVQRDWWGMERAGSQETCPNMTIPSWFIDILLPHNSIFLRHLLFPDAAIAIVRFTVCHHMLTPILGL